MVSVYDEDMKRLTVDLEEELFEKLRTAAFNQHEAMSVIARAALAYWLAMGEEPQEYLREKDSQPKPVIDLTGLSQEVWPAGGRVDRC